MKARSVTPADAAAVARIYNQGIEDRSSTFETTARTEEDRLRAIRESAGLYPFVVVEDDQGQVIAWAACSQYRPRDCYRGVAEFSVYVAREARGRGAGRVAMQALLTEAERAGFWKLLSRVFTDNARSRKLLGGLGFREVGLYEKHANLEGVWRDVVIVEHLIPSNLR